MNARHIHLVIGLVVAVIALLVPSAAAAAKGSRVEIDLAVEATEAPTDVCVISTKASADGKSIPVQDLLLMVADARGLPEIEAARRESWGSFRGVVEGLSTHASFAAKCRTDGAGPSCIPDLASDLDASRDLHIRCAQSVTSGDARQGLQRRVLILRLTTTMSPKIDQVPIDDLTLAGNSVELHLPIDVRATTAVLSVVSGHYLPNAGVELGRVRRELRLRPRCEWVRFELPPMLVRDPKLEPRVSFFHKPETSSQTDSQTDAAQAEPDAMPWSTCVRGDLGEASIDVLLPIDPQHEKQLVVEVDNGAVASAPDDAGNADDPKLAPSASGVVRLETSWTGSLPRPGTTLLATNLTFSWEVDSCMYVPDGVCPTAIIDESGLACASQFDRPVELVESETRTGSGAPRYACYYACPGTRSELDEPASSPHDGLVLSIAQPLHVVFSDRATSGRWNIALNSINQRLRGHVESAEREVVVGFRDDPNAHRHKWDYIKRVDFRYLDGHGQEVEQELSLDGAAYLRVPGAGCRDEITYTYQGSRHYYPNKAQISSGKLTLESALEQGRRFYLFVHAAPVMQFHMRRDLRESDANPFMSWGGDFEFGVSHWPLWRHRADKTPSKARGWRFEYRFGAMVNTVYAWPLSVDIDQPATRARRIPYLRLQPSIGFLSPWFAEWISLGAGVHAIVGRPLRQEDAASFFDQRTSGIDVGLRTSADLRVRLPFAPRVTLWRRFEVIVRISSIFFEDAPQVTTDLRGKPKLDLRESQSIWTTVGVGLAASF